MGPTQGRPVIMQTFRTMLVLRWVLAMATLFVALTYISGPTNNQCQMTFMMEPPRFIPIPISGQKHDSASDGQSDTRTRTPYTLFMYSEYGFPMESDLKRDLKDSMPVLFVPGNAGSYQQVRSLASTCIRRQLQSLDAFKFIFYTIDFRAQLTGISGKLIKDQMTFVDSALHQISKLHSMETNGVIVIGHSVGGFIAKALLAQNHFNHNRVPLLINLASPLTKSFVNFDDQMRQLFIDTNTYWSQQSNQSNTVSISISGGKSDRLVPMHLSLDPEYDVAITTSAIKGVWLTTDHVSITWCRELVQKLSQLLSNLMDKKLTRLIDDKNAALDIIRTQLLTKALAYTDISLINIPKGQRLIGTRDIEPFIDHITIGRNQMLEENKVLDMTDLSEENIIIWLEHIGVIKETGLYSCENIIIDEGQALCEGRLDLVKIARTLPSPRYEPNKKVILIKNTLKRLKYIVIAFANRSKNDLHKNQVPESISIQVTGDQSIQTINIPTLPQYIFRSIFLPHSLNLDVRVPKKAPLTYYRMRPSNLVQNHQFYSLVVVSEVCQSNDKSGGGLITIIRNGFVTESFYPDKATQAVIAKISQRETIIDRWNGHLDRDLLMDFFLDGTCDFRIKIEFDWWSFIENIIQENAMKILVCASYIAYIAMVRQISGLFYQSDDSIVSYICWFAGLILVYASSVDITAYAYVEDHIIFFISIAGFSMGLVALIESAVKRLLDLGLIAHRFTCFIRSKSVIRATSGESAHKNGISKEEKVNQVSFKKNKRIFNLGVEYSIICTVICASSILSEAIMRLCMLFIITLCQIRLKETTINAANPSNLNGHVKESNPLACPNQGLNCDALLYSVYVRLATLCALSFIANIPALLLEINPLDMNLSESLFKLNFFTSAGSLALIKVICDQLESLKSQDRWCQAPPAKRAHNHQPLAYPLKQSHILTLLPISVIRFNICYMNYAEFVTLAWTAIVLIKMKATEIKKIKTN